VKYKSGFLKKIEEEENACRIWVVNHGDGIAASDLRL
jgi:hypothetical protein